MLKDLLNTQNLLQLQSTNHHNKQANQLYFTNYQLELVSLLLGNLIKMVLVKVVLFKAINFTWTTVSVENYV